MSQGLEKYFVSLCRKYLLLWVLSLDRDENDLFLTFASSLESSSTLCYLLYLLNTVLINTLRDISIEGNADLFFTIA